ncbi:MAG: arginine--tRNA ligase [Patescibacteria group bacterium]|nr:arginine--tRNA ligase [Patescibacteria group bacterium]
MFSEQIKEELVKVLKKIAPEVEVEINLEHPAELSFGDYSTNIALVLAKKIGKNPRDFATELIKTWQEMGLPNFIEKIEVAGPGFLNIWLNFAAFSTSISSVLTTGNQYGSSNLLKEKKILLEHTSPNPQTTIMLGHLRNNFLGMSVAKILEFVGAEVKLDDVVNDRGVHICRSMFGYLVFANKENGLSQDELLNFREVSDEKIKALVLKAIPIKESYRNLLTTWFNKPEEWWTPDELSQKPDHANLIWYVLGSRSYKMEGIGAKEVVEELLVGWEKEDQLIRKLWQMILAWSEKGYAQTYERISSHHDWVWYESDHWKEGREIVEEGLKKGVFQESKGAIVTNLEKFGLPDTVVVKTDGTALYMTQDLSLTKLKKEKFAADLYIWDIGLEQTLYFQQLFAVVSELGIIEKEKLFHLAYALINFKGGGKMATRKGDVVMADEILDELHRRALEIIMSSNQELRSGGEKELHEVAEKVALAALKYSLLKYGRMTTMFFDMAESLALQGNSGPYLQYTYARTQSVLRKSEIRNSKSETNLKFEILNNLTIQQFSNEEIILLRTLYRFPEVIAEAAQAYSPNLVCNFLYDLAQKFNLFYDKHRILANSKQLIANSKELKAGDEVSEGQSQFRLALTAAIGQILKNGLTLLGIEALERM